MKPIFSRNDDHHKIAFLNWRIEKGWGVVNLFTMADGYFQSSLELAKQCLVDNGSYRADVLIFPILNNANHGIELYLKGIISVINEIKRDVFEIEKGHNIKQLFEIAKSKIKENNGKFSLKQFNKETKELSSYIKELFEKFEPDLGKEQMDFSRYPFTKKLLDHFYAEDMEGLKPSTTVDIENFIHRFTIIHNKLDAISNFLYYEELRQVGDMTYQEYLADV